MRISVTPLVVDTGRQKISINALTSDLDDAFREMYLEVISTGEFRMTDRFKGASVKLFALIEPEQKVEVSDAYFNNFTPLTETLRSHRQQHFAAEIWRQIVSFVREWEDVNQPLTLHKGTPYYFWGAMAMESFDVDTALMAMHDALEEDKKNQKDWRDRPAHFFFAIDDSKNLQYFKPFVDGMAEFIKKRLGEYRNQHGGKLDYAALRTKFLDNPSPDMEDLRYFFVYGVIRLWRLRTLHKARIGDSTMAPMIFAHSLIALLLMIDSLADRWAGEDTMAGHSYELALRMRWATGPKSKKDRQAYIDDLEINPRRNADFRRWVVTLLDRTYGTRSRAINPLEADFALSWGLRNFAAHTVESQGILWSNFTEVLQAIFNSLFISVELT